jgi:hypothetical protein
VVPCSIEVTGTYHPECEYGGTFFYGVHSAEMALELSGPTFTDVTVERVDEKVVHVRYRGAHAAVLLRLVTPEPAAGSWFGASVTNGLETSGGQIVLGNDYMAPVLDRFMEMIATGVAPLSADELLAPVALLAEIDEQLRRR